jgi:hypothetical protein
MDKAGRAYLSAHETGLGGVSEQGVGCTHPTPPGVWSSVAYVSETEADWGAAVELINSYDPEKEFIIGLQFDPDEETLFWRLTPTVPPPTIAKAYSVLEEGE